MFDLQKAYFLAEVINQDVPQDHVFFAYLYRFALKNKINYFISGGNFSSESILPKSWGFSNMDGKNLSDIHKKYGSIKLKNIKPKSFPFIMAKFKHSVKRNSINRINKSFNCCSSKAINCLNRCNALYVFCALLTAVLKNTVKNFVRYST